MKSKIKVQVTEFNNTTPERKSTARVPKWPGRCERKKDAPASGWNPIRVSGVAKTYMSCKIYIAVNN